MLIRRIRGLLTSMALGAIPWAALGGTIGIANAFGWLPGGAFITGPILLGSLVNTLVLVGAVVGAVNGGAFGILLMIAERRRGIAELRASRVGLWSALATGGTVLLISGSAVIAAGCALGGFGAGAAALRLAQRHSDEPQPVLDAPAV
jgi:hypothetical protein